MTGADRDGVILSPEEHRVLAALVTEPTRARAARAAGLSERTLRRWLADRPGFAAEYRRQARSAAEVAVSGLLAAQGVALAALVGVLEDPAASAASRVRAARAVLEVGARYADRDMEDRLDELEREVQRWADGHATFGNGWTR